MVSLVKKDEYGWSVGLRYDTKVRKLRSGQFRAMISTKDGQIFGKTYTKKKDAEKEARSFLKVNY